MRPSMPCPECGVMLNLVIDKRASGCQIRRRRVCEHGHRFTTYETVDSPMRSFDAGI